jgi:hypothetical protein
VLDLGEYLIAVTELAAIAAALAFGAVRLRAALMPAYSGAVARLGEAVLAVSTLLVVGEVLGLVGALEEAPLVVACVAVGVGQGLAATRLPGRRGEVGSETAHSERFRATPPVGGRRLQVGIAIAVSAVAFTHWAMPTLESFGEGIYGFDSQWYHLPFAARFAETGQVWDFHYTTPVLLSWFYPASSELLHAVGMVVTGRDLLSPAVNLGWLALALLAAWCLGRPWGVGGLSVLGAFVVLDAGLFADQAGDARNDVMAVALILAAAALLAQRPASVAGAGLAAGMALGTRLTSLGPVAALTAGVVWLARKGTRLRAGAIWVGAVALTGGLWFLRNLVATGNPLPQVKSLGPIDLPGPEQALGGRPSFSVFHYLADFDVWADWFAPALREGLGLLWPLVLALAAAGAVLAIWRGPSPAVRMLGAVAVVTAVVYVVTPVTASGPEGEPVGFGPNLRYLAPGLALALGLLPIALTTCGPRVQLAGAAGLTAAAIAVAAEAERWEEGRLLAALIVGALVALMLAGAALSRRRAPAGVIAGLAVVGLVGVGAAYFVQRHYLEHRYEDPAAVIPNPGLDSVFLWARGLSDARIATTTTRQYPLYGTELSNHVQFAGIERPEGGFVAPATCEEWREAVDAGDYDYVVTALDRVEEEGPSRPPEALWTETSPNAERILRDGPASVFELSGPLDPSECPS